MKAVDNVLVIGGGIAGIQASLDLADRGFNVYLVEKTPSIGGRMVQLDKTFPTMDCSICILAPKMIDVNRRQNVRLLTYSEVKEVRGEPGKFSVKVTRKPRFVDEEKCTGCGDCTEVCPVALPNEFDMALGTRTAIYRPFPQAVPRVFSIDKKGIPSCRAACPAGVNVQGYIALIREKKYKEALEHVRNDNPFPIICGRVCFHPCETDCERGSYDEPVAINALKRFVTDWELKYGMEEKIEPIPKIHEEKIAIIGSGPTGLTAAHELIKKGYPVTVFESLPEPGGMLRTGIPEYRLPKKLLEIEIKRLKDLGVVIQTSTRIGLGHSIDQLQQEGYKAILIAIGAQKSRKLGIEGENYEGVLAALEFLKDVNFGKRVDLGDRIVVIGGGNVAVDAARTALRLGSKDVKILYRRSNKEMPAFPSDAKEAENEGVKFQYLLAPKKILGEKGKVTGLKCIRMELGKPDKSGRKRPLPIKDSDFIVDADTVIVAIGETPDVSFLPEVEDAKSKTVECDPMTLATALEGVFAGGDVVSGPATVVDGIAAGKRVAISIDQYLRGEKLEGEISENEIVKEVSKENVEKKARQVVPVLSVKERIESFHEVETGFTEEMALQEAGRCLNCGGCSLCLECEKVCEPEAIIHDQKQEILDLDVGAIIVSTGFVPLDPSNIKEYGYGKYKNVLTSMELERLLSASGPTNGKLVRPSDNKIPHKIAFIQCVGSRSLKDNYSYCSSVCCMYATKEAALIKEHERESEVSIFYTDIRAFGKGFREFVNRAKEEWGIKYFRAKPSEIREDPKNQDLIIKYEDTLTGEMKSLKVDLVVLCTALVPPPDNKVLAEILGIKLDEYGFFQVGDLLLAPLHSTKPGIFLSGCCHNPQDIPDSVAEGKGAATKAAEFLARRRS
ncbi:MAG: FAD-dependent oxidoreductase [Candidatus Bathyarchaeota archaeon]|nr:MAG: FAD-dependent oxidoreductase [Candidatus Bathyarchaeota archaeon]